METEFEKQIEQLLFKLTKEELEHIKYKVEKRLTVIETCKNTERITKKIREFLKEHKCVNIDKVRCSDWSNEEDTDSEMTYKSYTLDIADEKFDTEYVFKWKRPFERTVYKERYEEITVDYGHQENCDIDDFIYEVSDYFDLEQKLTKGEKGKFRTFLEELFD